MGQYYMVVDLDKREFLHPHRLGSGLKVWEICAGNLPRVLAYLLKQSTGQGGGDPRPRDKFPNCGRWAGDRVVIVGDYDETEAFQGLYREVQDKEFWTEISPFVAPEFNRFVEFQDKQVDEPVAPEECEHGETWTVVDRDGVVVRETCEECHTVLRGGL